MREQEQQVAEFNRYFWKHYELNKTQFNAVRELGDDDTFVETPQHLRDDDFIRQAWT